MYGFNLEERKKNAELREQFGLVCLVFKLGRLRWFLERQRVRVGC